MRTRFISALSLLLCASCGVSAPDIDASVDDAAASTQELDAAAGDIDAAAAPSAARDGAAANLDASQATAEAGSDAEAKDACSGDACAARGECDDERPCGAPDRVCIDRACVADPGEPDVSWARSPWSGRAGRVDEDDTTLWCVPSAVAGELPTRVSSQFERVSLDGARKPQLTASGAAQRARFQCFADAAHTGSSTLVTTVWSSDASQQLSMARCPRERPYAAFLQCQIAARGKPPFVYAGPTCGDGVAGLAANPDVRGQLLGDHYELSQPGKPLFNNTAGAAVIGTDLGFQFLAQGRMYLGFGDTWENESSLPGPNGYRGSILAYTHDFDPADDNGIAFEGWETAPGRPNVAREVVPSAHDQSGKGEFTAIATSGFGLSDASGHYRFLWFAAIKTWDPFTTFESTLAWSKDGAPFVRGDQTPGSHPPRWPFASYFGPGAVWVDRDQGYIYFFGVRTYQQGFPVRLARVRGSLSAVLDHTQYEYWTGKTWQRPDPKSEYALAGLSDRAADLVPGSATQNNRPEISVAYNPYAGRFLLFLQNDATPFKDEADSRFELWQAESIEGPWTRADTGDHLVLPPHLYGPYMSEQTQSAGGRELFFALSEWNLLPLTLGQPYVVGLWRAQLQRRVRPGCAP